MENQIKTCHACKNDFTIELDDFLFYEKINVPPPTRCPDCRQQRRYAWRNERTLYRRDCDLCGKSTVTIYSPNKNLKVYCLKCWWSDDWDTQDYGKDFDFSRPFFEQYKELQQIVPRMALLNKNTINSEYCNHSGNDKNTYLSSVCFNCEDILYSNWVVDSRNSIDLSYVYSGAEKAYECIDSQKIYKCQFCYLTENCIECHYCYDCRNCSNCFMSSNLRNKNYFYKNEQLSKEEYLKKVKECNLLICANRKTLYNEYLNLIINDSLHKYIIGERNQNCLGNALFGCKNIKYSFDSSSNVEDSKYVISTLELKSAMDIYHMGWGADLSYECHGCNNLYKSISCHLCYDNQGIEYCDTCHNCTNLFGCISIKKGEYMILNKKHSKDEYLTLKNKIVDHMKNTGEYGEFFPPSISPVCYNETQGHHYMPLTKEEVLARGWQWEDKVPGIFGKETIKSEDISENIKDIKDDFTKEILACTLCSKNYNIATDELTFYKREEIPIPRECPDCRYKKRFKLRLPRKLWHRSCMKEGCINEFETSYAPNRSEIIYCERCYQQAVV